MLRDIFMAGFVSLLVGLVFTILEKWFEKMLRKYRFPWHIQRGERVNKLTWWKGDIVPNSEHMEWKSIDGNSHDLESAIKDLQMHREIFGGQHYRLRNWRTREIIPGEVLLSDERAISEYAE